MRPVPTRRPLRQILRSPEGRELPMVAGAVFMTVGAVMVVGGIALAFDEPGGLVLAGMGAAFAGAGYVARKLFTTPAGKRAVSVSTLQAGITTRYGTRGVRSQGSVIQVDADASDAEIERVRREWLQEQLAARPDWAAGRVAGDDQRSGSLPFWAAGAWVVFTAGMSAGAFFWDGMLWTFALLAALVTLGLLVNAVRIAWRRRKFAPSCFVMTEVPALLGARLTGEVQTGVRQELRPRDGFEVRLRCVHRWEERDHERRTRLRRDVLWEETQRCMAGAWGSGPTRHALPIDFQLPADLPATTLGGGNEGIRWELEARTSLPGLDYVARFDLPVLDPGETGISGQTTY